MMTARPTESNLATTQPASFASVTPWMTYFASPVLRSVWRSMRSCCNARLETRPGSVAEQRWQMVLNALASTCIHVGVNQELGNALTNRMVERFYLDSDRAGWKWLYRVGCRSTSPLVHKPSSFARPLKIRLGAVCMQDAAAGRVEVDR